MLVVRFGNEEFELAGISFKAERSSIMDFSKLFRLKKYSVSAFETYIYIYMYIYMYIYIYICVCVWTKERPIYWSSQYSVMDDILLLKTTKYLILIWGHVGWVSITIVVSALKCKSLPCIMASEEVLRRIVVKNMQVFHMFVGVCPPLGWFLEWARPAYILHIAITKWNISHAIHTCKQEKYLFNKQL